LKATLADHLNSNTMNKIYAASILLTLFFVGGCTESVPPTFQVGEVVQVKESYTFTPYAKFNKCDHNMDCEIINLNQDSEYSVKCNECITVIPGKFLSKKTTITK
jgi:hypothetical protein